MGDDDDPLPRAKRFLFKQDEQLKTRRVDLADLRQVELDVVTADQRIEQFVLLIQSVVDGHVFGKAEGLTGGHGGLSEQLGS